MKQNKRGSDVAAPGRWINDNASLQECCQHILQSGCRFLALDAEYLSSLHCFHQRVALIQITACSDEHGLNCSDFLLDPMRITDASPLAALLTNQDIEKLFHAADQDTAIQEWCKCEIDNVFDTQVAAGFLHPDKPPMGLYNLLENHLGLHLPIDKKRMQRSNWGVRPLQRDQQCYAQTDTRHLVRLRHYLLQQLSARFPDSHPHAHFILPLIKERSAITPGGTQTAPLAPKRPKQLPSMNQQQLHCLDQLLEHRFNIAKQADRPLHHVLANDLLVKVAVHLPHDRHSWYRIPWTPQDRNKLWRLEREVSNWVKVVTTALATYNPAQAQEAQVPDNTPVGKKRGREHEDAEAGLPPSKHRKTAVPRDVVKCGCDLLALEFWNHPEALGGNTRNLIIPRPVADQLAELQQVDEESVDRVLAATPVRKQCFRTRLLEVLKQRPDKDDVQRAVDGICR
eukprot:TRINITY_DN68013_c4_g1_i1.p1 TRINITY_DN68013_c4_g1~~TRINITY_DN68013_c4_g1_i1.p1  ORF type:complete len:455 (-),score=41.80 TRINITY_DN68013_c4_g1_i1:1117-2481(-)